MTMNCIRRTATVAAIAGLLLPTAGQAQAKAHAHGIAQLDIAFDGRVGMMQFEAPSEDVYGFEREPRTDAERAARDQALSRLRTDIGRMVRFDAALRCAIFPKAVEVESNDGHTEVHARYAVACATAPAGKPIAFGFTQAFPSIRTVQVQAITDAGQDGKRIDNDRGTVTP